MDDGLRGRTLDKKTQKLTQAPWVEEQRAQRGADQWEKKVLSQRPIWRGGASSEAEFHRKHWVFFCPLCRAQRVVKMRPKPESLENILRISLTTVALTLALWPICGARGLFLGFPIWAVFEVFYRVRLRSQVACQKCGFDAYLYLSDLPKARATVEEFWKGKVPAAQGPAQAPVKQKDSEQAQSLTGLETEG